MTTADLIQRVQQKLGEQSSFYTDAEIVVNGLNPAQRLLVLTRPALLMQRTTVTVAADLPFYNLRSVQPRIRRLTRVVLGTITGDDPTAVAATGEYRELTPTSLAKLQATPDWLRQKGAVEHYWLWGSEWLGLYRRPISASVVTLIYQAVPTALDVNTPTVSPVVVSAYHPLLADLAAGLLLVKEGAVEGERGLTKVQEALAS